MFFKQSIKIIVACVATKAVGSLFLILETACFSSEGAVAEEFTIQTLVWIPRWSRKNKESLMEEDFRTNKPFDKRLSERHFTALF
jgi:hypothetical protein